MSRAIPLLPLCASYGKLWVDLSDWWSTEFQHVKLLWQ
jgi:hypothetical protein